MGDADRAEAPELSAEEIEAQGGDELPDREQMSLIDGNIAAPVNAAAAVNLASDGAVTGASSTQDAPVTQGN
jgi:hypothetical protein